MIEQKLDEATCIHFLSYIVIDIAYGRIHFPVIAQGQVGMNFYWHCIFGGSCTAFWQVNQLDSSIVERLLGSMVFHVSSFIIVHMNIVSVLKVLSKLFHLKGLVNIHDLLIKFRDAFV